MFALVSIFLLVEHFLQPGGPWDGACPATGQFWRCFMAARLVSDKLGGIVELSPPRGP
jgi:hypothetical protein